MSALRWMPILMYHRIVEREPDDDPYQVCTSVSRLAAHLDWFEARGFSAVPLELACQEPEPYEGRRYAITFDDGYVETLRLALPELTRRSLPATVFVVSRMLGASATWNAEPQSLISRSELQELHSAGMLVGSHSRTHPRLSTLRREEIEDEVRGSRDDLEDILGSPVRFFAYPFFDLNLRVLDAVEKAGYAGAAGGREGQHERYNLHRVNAGRMTLRQLALHASGLHRWARRQPLPRAVRGLAARLG